MLMKNIYGLFTSSHDRQPDTCKIIDNNTIQYKVRCVMQCDCSILVELIN